MRLLENGASAAKLDFTEALQYINDVRTQPIQITLNTCYKHGVMPDAQAGYVRKLVKFLRIPQQEAEKFTQRLEDLKLYEQYVKQIAAGDLPEEDSPFILAPGEVCHYKEDCVYIRQNGGKPIEATLVCTSQRLVLLGVLEFPWSRVQAVEYANGLVVLFLSTQKGSGSYDVIDPATLLAIIQVLSRNAALGDTPKKSRSKPAPTPQERTPYDILQVSPGATEAEITAAYREMVKMYHPDKVASLAPEYQVIAEHRTKEINAAYQTLLILVKERV